MPFPHLTQLGSRLHAETPAITLVHLHATRYGLASSAGLGMEG
jgi:hypothetical protein